MSTKYCSPAKQHNINKFNSCFDKPALIRLINAFNDKFPEQAIIIKGLEKKSYKVLYKQLYKRFEKICGTDETCWIDKTNLDNDAMIKDYLRPKSPRTWKINPREWLDENNINDVLRQYETAYAPYYKYFGTQSADFLRKDFTNSCHNKHLCSINVKELYDSGVRTIGMVINLDPHYMGGSHWTSLFICICPLKPCFGAYYYDSSVSKYVPDDVITFMDNIEKQCKGSSSKRVFKKKFSSVRHQYGNTECGVFSIYNQIKWLECSSKEKGHSSFNEVFNSKITDEQMVELRKALFRPI